MSLIFSETVTGGVSDGVLVVTIDNPPVNAASADMRQGLFAAIDECRFKRVVQPGDRLTLEVTMAKLGGRFGRGHAFATVEGEVCCEADLSFIIPREGVLA